MAIRRFVMYDTAARELRTLSARRLDLPKRLPQETHLFPVSGPVVRSLRRTRTLVVLHRAPHRFGVCRHDGRGTRGHRVPDVPLREHLATAAKQPCEPSLE